MTSIGEYAFAYCNALTSIIIPDSVTNIGEWAFWNCNALTSITIPEGVTSIGSYAFNGCDSLKTVYVEGVDTIPELGSDPFYYVDFIFVPADKIDEYKIKWDYYNSRIIPDKFYCGADDKNCYATYDASEGTLTISGSGEMKDYNHTSDEYSGWYSCNITSYITSIVIEDGVTSIGDYAFCDCNCTAITIPESVVSIGDSAFYGCSKLTSIAIPDSVTSIGDYAFAYCYELTSITIPDSVTSIGEGTFYQCSKLTSVTVPDGVTSIGDNAFWDCGCLTSITIPESVTSIGDYAFEGCSSLTSVYFKRNSPCELKANVFAYTPDSLILIVPDGKAENYQAEWTEYADKIKTASLKEYLVTFKVVNGSWDDGTNTDKPVTLKGFEVDTLKLAAADIPAVGTKPNDYFVTGSWDTTPNTITAITGDVTYTYTYAPAPKSGTVGGCTWSLSDDLETLTVSKAADGNGDMGDFDQYDGDNPAPWMYARTDIKNIIVGDGVTRIGSWAFFGCENVESVTLGTDITTISDAAFYGLDKLTEITLPANLTIIGQYALAYTGLTEISIPENIETIGNYAFGGCNNFTDITIPGSVKTIGEGAFYDCDNLTSLTVSGNAAIIGWGTFAHCDKLNDVTIKTGVKEIEPYAFYECYELESANIEVGENGLKIWAWAFDESTDVVLIPKVSGTGMKKLKTSFGELTADGTTGKVTLSVDWYPYQDELAGVEHADLSLETVTPVITVADATYTGSALEPAVTVKDGTATLTLDKDYTVSYSDNTNAGTGTVTIIGKGIYGGSATQSFTIEKAESPNKPGATLTASYGTLKVSEVSLPDGWAWAAADKDKELTVGTGVTATAEYTGNDKANYKDTSVSISVVMSACTHGGLVKTDAVSATCTAAGNSAYWTCGDCGKYFSDADGSNEITENSWIIQAKGHTPKAAVKESVVEATYEADGSYDEVVYCENCTEKISSIKKTVPALSHTYGEPVYEWNSDYTKCTATVVCTDDSNHKITEDATISSRVTKAATVDSMGVTEYTAVFTNALFETQVKEVENIEKLNSSVDPNPDDPNHNSELHNHTLVKTNAVPATCEKDGNIEYWTCTDCGANFSDADGKNAIDSIKVNALGHDYGTPTYTWSADYSTCTAKVVCVREGCAEGAEGHAITETAASSSRISAEPTEYEMGVTSYVVSFDSKLFTDQAKHVENIPKKTPANNGSNTAVNDNGSDNTSSSNSGSSNTGSGNTGSSSTGSNNTGSNNSGSNNGTNIEQVTESETGKDEKPENVKTTEVKNEDGSVTITTEHSDGKTTVSNVKENADGTISTVEETKDKNGETLNVKEETKDKDDNILYLREESKDTTGKVTERTVTKDETGKSTVTEKTDDGKGNVKETKTVTNPDKSKEVTESAKYADGSSYEKISTISAKGKVEYTEKTVSTNGNTTTTTGSIYTDSGYEKKTEVRDAEGNLISTTEEVSEVKDNNSVQATTTVKYANKASEKITVIVDPDGSITTKIVDKDSKKQILSEYTSIAKANSSGNLVEKGTLSFANGDEFAIYAKTYKSGKIKTKTTKNYADPNAKKVTEKVTVSKNGNGKVVEISTKAKTIIIPEKVMAGTESYVVKSIAAYAFQYNSRIKKVVIPGTVTSIGDKAFFMCKNLKTIELTASIKSIGNDAFSGIKDDAEFIITASEEDFDRIVDLIKASGVSENTKFTRK